MKNIVSSILSLLLLLCVLPAWAQTTRYAHPSGGGGSCTNAGTPCSLQNGLDALEPGDTLIMQEGTYTAAPGELGPSQINIFGNASGSAGAHTRMRTAPGATVVIIGAVYLRSNLHHFTLDGRDGVLIFDGNRHGGFVTETTVTNIRFERFESRWALMGFGGVYYFCEWINLNVHHFGVDENNLKTDECTCASGDVPEHGDFCGDGPSQPSGHCHGVYSQLDSHDNVFDGNIFSNGEGWGLHLYGNNQTARNNHIMRNFGRGIGTIGNGMTAYNNVIHNNSSGIWLGGANNNLIYNNTVVENEQSGIDVPDPASNNQIINNIVLDNQGGSIFTQGGGGYVFASNLCNNIGLGCTHSGNAEATFASAPGDDYHLTPGSQAINMGTVFAGISSTDHEGNQRPEPGGTFVDIGAYECQATQAGDDCTGSGPVQPCTGCLVVEHKTDGTDTSGNNFPPATLTGGTLTNGQPLTSNNTTSFVFDGVNDAMVEANDPVFRSPTFCMTFWVNSATLPTPDVCRAMSLGTAVVLGINTSGDLFGYINNGAAEVVQSINAFDGSTHLLGLGYDGAMLRLWKDNANPFSVPFAGGIAYAGNELLVYGGVPGKYCPMRANNFRFFNSECTPSGMQVIYDERLATIGTTTTRWHFYQADAAEGTLIAGQGWDAPTITQARSGKLRMSWNVKRNGSTQNEHFRLECSLNGGGFALIDNSCATNPACIATDTVKNMGDPTAALDMPLDGFIFVPGLFVVDTLNTGILTSLPDARVTRYEWGLAFNQTLAHNDVLRCRPRMTAGVFDSYPAVLPTIIIDVTTPTGGSNLEGGKFEGVTVQ